MYIRAIRIEIGLYVWTDRIQVCVAKLLCNHTYLVKFGLFDNLEGFVKYLDNFCCYWANFYCFKIPNDVAIWPHCKRGKFLVLHLNGQILNKDDFAICKTGKLFMWTLSIV